MAHRMPAAVLLAIALGAVACGAAPAHVGAPTPSALASSPSASAVPTPATAAGVQRIALTAALLKGYRPQDAADESLSSTSYEICNRSWTHDSERVAQSERSWVSPTHILLDDLVVGYDSDQAAAGALAEFRGAAATCPAFTVQGAHIAFVLRPFALDARARADLPGDDGFLMELSVKAAGKTYASFHAVVRRGAYLVVCSTLGPSASETSPIAGLCAGLSQPALVAVTG
jgi:hypothetical protein